VAKQQNSGIGCFTVIALLVLLGLTIEYWYVSVPIIVVCFIGGLSYRAKQKQQKEELARHRPGPRDPWLNEIAVALAEFGFTEYARNTGSQVTGVPIEGDIRLDAERFSVIITLLTTAELAHQAEIGLRAKPQVRAAIADGKTIVSAEDRMLYVANGRGGYVDEQGLNEVQQLVCAIPVGLARQPVAPSAPAPRPDARPKPPPPRPAPQAHQTSGDVLDQIKRMAELRDSGVLSAVEFEAKKAELLRRL
jgi:hypothetical protein